MAADVWDGLMEPSIWVVNGSGGQCPLAALGLSPTALAGTGP